MLAVELAPSLPPVSLTASLYSNRGKLAVEITHLGEDGATVVAPELPPAGSFAFLVRNGVKLPTRIAWGAEGRLGLDFEERLTGDRREEDFRRGFRPSDLIA